MLSHQRENTTKKEKVVTVKSVDIGLPGTRKKRAFKEQIETFVEGMTPLKKANTQQDTLNKGKHDEIQKHTQSKTKEVVTTKSRVINYPTDKEEKVTSNDLIPLSVNIEVVPFDKDLPVIVGDNAFDKDSKTYNIKFIDKESFEKAMTYWENCKRWNSRADIASKTEVPVPEPSSLKIGRPELTQSKTKENLTTKSRLSVLISVLKMFANKEEKETSNDLIPLPVNIEVVPFDKDSPVIVGDNGLSFYCEGEKSPNYDIKFIDKESFERAMTYWENYKGWNSRADIASKTEDPVPEPFSLKISLPESSSEETIQGNPTSTSEELNNQEERKKDILSVGYRYSEMTSPQRQSVLLAIINELKSSYKEIHKKLARTLKIKRRIEKRKRKKAKATTTI